jgi:hypothetical protein
VSRALAGINAKPAVHGPDECRKIIDQESSGFAAVAKRIGLKS